MISFHPLSRRLERSLLAVIVVLFAGVSIVGITWGLPSRKIDRFLFGNEKPWSGEKIYRLAGAASKFSPDRGADVDADPLKKTGDEPVLLTGTDEDIAKIYLRYRLYTYQPDEMITMMALAGMRPRELKFDPRLYQYGGAFIYPVGALIGACGWLGLIDVRSDVVYYLDHPDEFGKFYVVARAYSAAWGLLGVILVFAIARRIARGSMGKRTWPLDESEPRAQATGYVCGGSRAGLLAALLFALMPVVVCMSHEGKPHLPGAVLMLAAVLFAMRYLSAAARRRDWWLMCICCGAAFGMVLSSLPIFVLIPLVAWLDARRRDGLRACMRSLFPRRARKEAWVAPGGKRSLTVAARLVTTLVTRALSNAAAWCKQSAIGVGLAIAVYLVTNPYIVINAITNRDVLRSNFGNSLAMYEIARIGEGFLRVLELTIEGVTLPVVLVGAFALLVALWRMMRQTPSEPGAEATGHAVAAHPAMVYLPLIVPAAVFFVQFVLIGAGKPAEYGRFGIFPNTALAIGAACVLTRRWTKLREIVNWIPAVFVLIGISVPAYAYLYNFRWDTQTGRYSVVEPPSVGTGCYIRGHGPEDSWREPFTVAVIAEPAPYCFPPIQFDRARVVMFREYATALEYQEFHRSDTLVVRPVDEPVGTDRWRAAPDLFLRRFVGRLFRVPFHGALTIPQPATPISWAIKLFEVRYPDVSASSELWRIDTKGPNP